MPARRRSPLPLVWGVGPGESSAPRVPATSPIAVLAGPDGASLLNSERFLIRNELRSFRRRMAELAAGGPVECAKEVSEVVGCTCCVQLSAAGGRTLSL